jgi:hypothetical protein
LKTLELCFSAAFEDQNLTIIFFKMSASFNDFAEMSEQYASLYLLDKQKQPIRCLYNTYYSHETEHQTPI